MKEKTKLIIEEDLKKYLLEEIDRSSDENWGEASKRIGRDPFNFQWIFKFDNDKGASVVKHWGSYGFERDLFEVAVLYFDGDDWHLTYSTEITDDVIGYLKNEEVMDILNKIKNL